MGQPGVRAARVAADGRIDVESHDVDRALVALVQHCAAQAVPLASLEVLKPNLESVFLHLTGKRLRDE
jgi:ABC-2 type transport system ATP-binding protein